MENETNKQHIKDNLTMLEARLDELISRCEQLAQENRSLRSQQAELQAERDALTRDYEQVHTRLNLMVMRLRGLDLQ